jgi:hypothetical protein
LGDRVRVVEKRYFALSNHSITKSLNVSMLHS